MEIKKEFLKKRRFNGDEYNFYKDEDTILCYPPDNSFDYGNLVILTHGNNFSGAFGGREKIAIPNHRPITPWILKKIESVMILLYNENFSEVV